MAYGSKTLSPTQLKLSIYAKESVAFSWLLKYLDIILDRLFYLQTTRRSHESPIQKSFRQHSGTRAADYLSRLEIALMEKLMLRITEDIPITPIELNVQSAEVS